MGIQMKCFSEIINIGYIVYKSQNLPLFRSLSWYFLLTANYFIFGESIIDQFGVLLNKTVSQVLVIFSLLRIDLCLFSCVVRVSLPDPVISFTCIYFHISLHVSRSIIVQILLRQFNISHCIVLSISMT